MSEAVIAPERGPGALDAIRAIALNTFREAIRDRILYLFLVFALLLIGASRFLSLLTVGSEDKIIMDLGLAAIEVFGVLTAVFLGVSLVFKEIDRKTVYTLLANPVRRWQFVFGKYLGLQAVLIANLTLMALALTTLMGLRGQPVGALLPAVLLAVVELALINAVAILFSCYTNPLLASLGTLSVYVVGQLAWSLELLGARLAPGGGRLLCDVLYWLVPNLSLLNVRPEVVHALPLDAGRVLWGAIYGSGYAMVVLALACVVLERRDFK